VLTNWVRERPFSVILFDEIEKAHPKTFDKFLQIIDDGRLTDGQGRTTYFAQTIVIFTSNIGASEMREEVARFGPESPPTYAFVEKHFKEAVSHYMTHELRRPELLGRLGSGVIVFDILRQPVVEGIVGKLLGQLKASAAARGVDVVFDRRAIAREVVAALNEAGAELGARQIRSQLELWVRVPLSRWLVSNIPQPGQRIWIHGTVDSPPFTVGLYPGDVDRSVAAPDPDG
jgi:ATP-dependent Clp protease ATP-binding subunit ClpA